MTRQQICSSIVTIRMLPTDLRNKLCKNAWRESEATTKPIDARWFHHMRGDEVQSRLADKYLKSASEREDAFAAAPTPVGLRMLLGIAMARNFAAQVGGFSCAFTRAELRRGRALFPTGAMEI
eukprot:1523589-Pyramimonas_sp.AAC.1